MSFSLPIFYYPYLSKRTLINFAIFHNLENCIIQVDLTLDPFALLSCMEKRKQDNKSSSAPQLGTARLGPENKIGTPRKSSESQGVKKIKIPCWTMAQTTQGYYPCAPWDIKKGVN